MLTVRNRNGRFQAIVRAKRNGVIVFEEARTFPTEALARDWGRRLDAKVQREGAPAARQRTKTLSELLVEHIEALEANPNVKLRRTRVTEVHQLASDNRIGKLKLSELEPHHFSDWAAKRRAEGAGPTTVLHNLATIRATLNVAKPLYGYDVRPEVLADAIKALKQSGTVTTSRKRERRPTEDELQQLRKEFDRVAYHPCAEIPMRKILDLAIALPRRLGELCSMRWEDLDGRVVKLRDTKHPEKLQHRRDEMVPMTPEARAIIKTLPRLDDRVLPYNADSVSAAFQRACARLRIDDLRFHDLRHEGISRLFERGLAIEEVAQISGHTNWTTLRRYVHLSAHRIAEKLHAGQQETSEADSESA